MLKVIASIYTVLIIICTQPQSLRLPHSLVEYLFTLPPQDYCEGMYSLHQISVVTDQGLLVE